MTTGLSLAVLSAAALLVAGCSGDSRESGPVTGPKRKPAAAAAVDLQFAAVPPESSGVDHLFSSGHETSDNSILAWMGGGVALLDYDGNGRLDLVFPGGGGFEAKSEVIGAPTKLYRHLDPWQFEDVSLPTVGDNSTRYTQGAHVADYDNDGFPDLLVTGYGGLQLLQNLGDGTFLDVTDEARLDGDRLWSTSAAWADFDGDGLLDLYVAHYVDWSFDNHPPCATPSGEPEACPPWKFARLPDALYFNNGDGTFRDGSEQAGLRDDGMGLGVLAADIDLDDDVDLYVANDSTANFLYINDGAGRFEETGLIRGVSGDDVGDTDGSMGVDVGDYDLDGQPDLWVANYVREAFALYRNLGGGQFQHVSRATGINNLGGLFVGFGTAFADLEGDGDEDLVVANGHVLNRPPTSSVKQLPLLLINMGQRYERVELDEDVYFGRPHLGRGLAASDLDDDGDLDLVVSHLWDEPPALLSNETPQQGQWLRVRLIGVRGNRDAIGGRLVLHTSKGRQLRMAKGGSSYLSHTDLRPFFGIPTGAAIQRLVVTWPSGHQESLEDIEPNQTLVIYEPESGSGSESGSE